MAKDDLDWSDVEADAARMQRLQDLPEKYRDPEEYSSNVVHATLVFDGQVANPDDLPQLEEELLKGVQGLVYVSLVVSTANDFSHVQH